MDCFLVNKHDGPTRRADVLASLRIAYPRSMAQRVGGFHHLLKISPPNFQNLLTEVGGMGNTPRRCVGERG